MGVYSSLAASVTRKNTVAESATQLNIDMLQEQMSMFNALIECDFAQAYNEAGIICLEEGDSEKVEEKAKSTIGEKIKAAWNKFVEFVKKTVGNIISAIQQLFQNDKAMYIKYAGKLTAENIKGCEAKGEVVNYGKSREAFQNVDDSINLNEALDKIKNASSEEDVDNIVKSFNEDADKFVEMFSKEDFMKGFFNSEDKPIAEKVDLDNLLNDIKEGGKNIIYVVNKVHKISLAQAKIGLREAEIDMKMADDKDKLGTKKASAKYNVNAKAVSVLTKYVAVSMAITKKVVKVDRSNFIVLGKYAAGKGEKKEEPKTAAEKQENNNESALYADLSDYFVESTFGED